MKPYDTVIYQQMTNDELADDLDRWATVRNGLDKRIKEGSRFGRPLASGNLREAARRLRGLKTVGEAS